MTASVPVLHALFRDATLPQRAHVVGRALTCPLDALSRALPSEGRILDVGCGHGVVAMHLALASPAREVVGVDIDDGKIAVARRASARGAALGLRTRFDPCARELPAGPWDAVLLVDVLYLLRPGAQREMIARCARLLGPRSTLAVKAIATRPRWKLGLTLSQEHLATRVARITRGEVVSFLPLETTAGWMREVVDDVRVLHLDSWRPHAHALLLGRASAAAR